MRRLNVYHPSGSAIPSGLICRRTVQLSGCTYNPKGGMFLTRRPDVDHPGRANWCTALRMYDPMQPTSTILDKLMYNPLDVNPLDVQPQLIVPDHPPEVGTRQLKVRQTNIKFFTTTNF